MNVVILMEINESQKGGSSLPGVEKCAGEIRGKGRVKGLQTHYSKGGTKNEFNKI